MKKLFALAGMFLSIALFLFVSEARAEEELLRAPDGALVLEGMKNVAGDGKKIYFGLQGYYGSYSLKEGKKTKDRLFLKMKKGEKEPFYYLAAEGEDLYGMTTPKRAGEENEYEDAKICRRKKGEKEFKEIGEGLGFVVTKDHIYFVKPEDISMSGSFYEWKKNCIYRMDLDGKNVKKMKEVVFKKRTGRPVTLYRNGDRIYYKKNGKFYTLSGKKLNEKTVIDDGLKNPMEWPVKFDTYLKNSGQKVVLRKDGSVDLGTYKDGKWEFKKIKQFGKKVSINGIYGIGEHFLLWGDFNGGGADEQVDLYDLTGKFIKRLHPLIVLAG